MEGPRGKGQVLGSQGGRGFRSGLGRNSTAAVLGERLSWNPGIQESEVNYLSGERGWGGQEGPSVGTDLVFLAGLSPRGLAEMGGAGFVPPGSRPGYPLHPSLP